jgi:hypothetical protein
VAAYGRRISIPKPRVRQHTHARSNGCGMMPILARGACVVYACMWRVGAKERTARKARQTRRQRQTEANESCGRPRGFRASARAG